uniref:Uncharacterized protein n=1 Tax=Vespula pensylvanica TaxID=30213 RepID=A0A834K5Y2_VESPE|nr:hypothetical protein H0235_015769 [Vespula pensylvanica]
MRIPVIFTLEEALILKSDYTAHRSSTTERGHPIVFNQCVSFAIEDTLRFARLFHNSQPLSFFPMPGSTRLLKPGLLKTKESLGKRECCQLIVPGQSRRGRKPSWLIRNTKRERKKEQTLGPN